MTNDQPQDKNGISNKSPEADSTVPQGAPAGRSAPRRCRKICIARLAMRAFKPSGIWLEDRFLALGVAIGTQAMMGLTPVILGLERVHRRSGLGRRKLIARSLLLKTIQFHHFLFEMIQASQYRRVRRLCSDHGVLKGNECFSRAVGQLSRLGLPFEEFIQAPRGGNHLVESGKPSACACQGLDDLAQQQRQALPKEQGGQGD